MFSLCKKPKSEDYEHGGAQIKGGYMLRYKKRLLWGTWSEEWVVLYDDSTMAWFKDSSGKRLATQKHLVKESPEMLAIAKWTGQVPRRPPLPAGTSLAQLMVVGSRRDSASVVWMLAKSEAEMRDWMTAISKTLPPPPHIELVMTLPHLRTAFKRPTVRVRPATPAELAVREVRRCHGGAGTTGEGVTTGKNLVAVLKRQVPLAGQLHRELEWGQGWGWVTLPNGVWSGNRTLPDRQVPFAGQLHRELEWGQGWGWVTHPDGVWSGRLTWSQEGDDFALHATPLVHHSNAAAAGACAGPDGAALYEGAYERSYADYGGVNINDYDDAGAEDWDFNVDCGDFMM